MAKTLSIEQIEERIVQVMETGKDPAVLLKRLAKEKQAQEAAQQKQRLSQIAEQRTGYRAKAAELVQRARVKKDSAERFMRQIPAQLEKVNDLLASLKELGELEKVSPTWDEVTGDIQFWAEKIPSKYLPADFTVPYIQSGEPRGRNRRIVECLNFWATEMRNLLAGITQAEMIIRGNPCLRDDTLQPQAKETDSPINDNLQPSVAELEPKGWLTDFTPVSGEDCPAVGEIRSVEHFTEDDINSVKGGF